MHTYNKDSLRSVIFGVEDSLVSTTGLLVGVAVGSNDHRFVLLAGIVGVAVEALSMGAGEYLSEDAVEDIGSKQTSSPLRNGIYMLIAYALAGCIPLMPMALLDISLAVWISPLAALAGLFALGYVKGRLLGKRPIFSGLKILVVGGLAALLGVAVGLLFHI